VTTIQLNQKWELLNSIGDPGGFGRVFLARSEDKSEAVIKLIKKEPGADRELLFEELSGVSGIIPVLESGETADDYVLLMPRAEKSLRAHILASGGKLAAQEATQILKQIAEALTGLANRTNPVVHRDLKPENVLYWNGNWCISDFGISRYAEASTASDTRKFYWTRPYAAPEQWRQERATQATDVYALGVLGFELLSGQRPFPGPDFMDQHLKQPPPSLQIGIPSLEGLITDCLIKTPGARPRAATVVQRLSAVSTPVSPAVARLKGIEADAARIRVEASAIESAQQIEQKERQGLFTFSQDSLKRIVTNLGDEIQQHAPSVTRDTASGLIRLRLGRAMLWIETPKQARLGANYPVNPTFNVISYTRIVLKMNPPKYGGYDGRSHSLWFCDAQHEGEYRWFESAFWSFNDADMGTRPFALDPEADAYLAVLD
jgi:eukaryotic-like serine/threonine-protein kinase